MNVTLSEIASIISAPALIAIAVALWRAIYTWGALRTRIDGHDEKFGTHNKRLERLEDVLPRLLTREEYVTSTQALQSQLSTILAAIIQKGN